MTSSKPIKTETQFFYTLIRVNPCFRAISIKRLRFQVLSMSEATNLHLAPTTCNLERPTQPSYSVKNSSLLPCRWRASFFLLRLLRITSRRTEMPGKRRRGKKGRRAKFSPSLLTTISLAGQQLALGQLIIRWELTS